MRSLNRLGTQPISLPLTADDIVEFHAGRLLLLIEICGIKGSINGLTKMAKLDFFSRYPDFFEVARAAFTPSPDEQSPKYDVPESAMVRYHYGPWDKRYYHVLAYLEARGLINVRKEKKAYQISLTDLGRERAKLLAARPSFTLLVARMKEVKKVFGGKTGGFLKTLIYQVFDKEVGQRAMGKRISR